MKSKARKSLSYTDNQYSNQDNPKPVISVFFIDEASESSTQTSCNLDKIPENHLDFFQNKSKSFNFDQISSIPFNFDAYPDKESFQTPKRGEIK